jgi:MSHA biogenesis protein MshP
MYLRSGLAYSKQRGLGLPTALFIILVMILVVAGINQINEMNASAYGREWLSMRAFYAAESGAQSAAVHALNSGQSMSTCDAAFISGVTPNVTGLRDCSISVSCESHVIATETYYTFTSTGQCGIGPDAATRIVQVRLQQ